MTKLLTLICFNCGLTLLLPLGGLALQALFGEVADYVSSVMASVYIKWYPYLHGIGVLTGLASLVLSFSFGFALAGVLLNVASFVFSFKYLEKYLES